MVRFARYILKRQRWNRQERKSFYTGLNRMMWGPLTGRGGCYGESEGDAEGAPGSVPAD